jgi:hypothetical protein
MSGASNLGYGNTAPLSNIDGDFANIDNSHYSGNFGSNEIKGGKRKIRAISKRYKKMKAGKRKSIKRQLKTMFSHIQKTRQFAGKRRRAKKTHKRRKSQRGGYGQYYNNYPSTTVAQVAGVTLPASQLGLANPPPIQSLGNCTNCVDNYNHYTNQGFPSKGH